MAPILSEPPQGASGGSAAPQSIPHHQLENIDLYGFFELFQCFSPFFPWDWFLVVSHGFAIITATYLLQSPLLP